MVSCDLVVRGGDVILPARGRTKCDIAIQDGRYRSDPRARRCVLCERRSFGRGGWWCFPARSTLICTSVMGVISRSRACRSMPTRKQQRPPAAASRRSFPTSWRPSRSTRFFRRFWTSATPAHVSTLPITSSFRPKSSLRPLPKYVKDLGVTTFKIFMNIRGGEGKRLGLPDIDDGFLLRLCEAAAASGGQVYPHPETIEMSWPLRDRLMAKDPDGKGGLKAWNGSRPPFVEADAIQHAAYVASTTGTRMYIVHVSVQRSASGRAAHAPLRRAHRDGNLPALPHARRELEGRRHRQDQSAGP